MVVPFFTVKQQTAAVVTRFGKFTRIANPGLNILVPFIERVAGHVNLRVRQLARLSLFGGESNYFRG